MGTKKITNVEPEKNNAPIWQDFLTINLKMKTSDVFKDGTLNEEEEADEDAEKILAEKKFPWHC